MNKAAAIHAQPPTIIALVLFTLISLGLGVVANLANRKGSFLEKYFLGNRSLGPFAVALTAAVMSGGTFMGFLFSWSPPSAGWSVLLDRVLHDRAPLTVLGALGKRIGHLSRKTGRGDASRLFPRTVRQPVIGALDQCSRDVLPLHQPRRPVLRGCADHEDRPPWHEPRPSGSSPKISSHPK